MFPIKKNNPVLRRNAEYLYGCYGDGLPERERFVFERVFGLNGQGECSYRVVGEQLGIGIERVRQIWRIAYNRMCEWGRRDGVFGAIALLKNGQQYTKQGIPWNSSWEGIEAPYFVQDPDLDGAPSDFWHLTRYRDYVNDLLRSTADL